MMVNNCETDTLYVKGITRPADVIAYLTRINAYLNGITKMVGG